MHHVDHPALAPLVDFAIRHETPWARDPGEDGAQWGIHQADPPPWNRLLGPVSARGPASGVVRVDGVELASWGEPDRADLTFSVAKTYLALLAGVAFDRGLLDELDAPIGRGLPGIGFDGPHNGAVTWRHMLQQRSEWEGSCWGVPDQVDRYRRTEYEPIPAAAQPKGAARPLQAPGTLWEYNDVRVNQFALALTHLFGQPLPEVFDEAIMRPVGASDDWRWVGYDNAWVTIGGRQMPSVPGGTHWGGGVTISARDQARIGQMLLDDGLAGGRRVLSSSWLERMREPCPIARFYGFLLWLNVDGAIAPAASRASVFAIGAGSSITWIEPARRAVVVARWLDGPCLADFVGVAARALDAARGAGPHDGG